MTDDEGGWTLVARFSNSDDKNWMKDTGLWWYDQQVAIGATTDPSNNTDMIAPAFWLVNGKDFKITRSDDPGHTLLCYRPQVTVWLEKHSDQELQVMVTSEMAKLGPGTSALEIAPFNMAVSTSQQTAFNRLSAAEKSKAPRASDSGVTRTKELTRVMDQ